jgi:hypothetical protein
MDQFLVSLLLLDEGARVALAFALIILGGFVGSRIFTVKVSLRRVAYLWWFASINLVLTISQMIWAATPTAAEGEYLSALILSGMGAFLVYGAALYYGSAARSNHIKGTTGSAWLGFVPFANLWLLLKGTEIPSTDAQQRPALSRYVLDPVLVISALFVLSFSQVISKIMEHTAPYDTAESQTLQSLITNAQTLEESFAAEAQASGAQLPIRIDEITTLRSISAEGKTLRMKFDVEREIGGFKSGFEAQLASQQCDPSMFATDIARGGRVVMVYYGPGGGLIDEFEITQADCQ